MLVLLPQAIVDGILLGGIYLTVAMGFSLCYGVLHVIDFAVGEWIMLGAFVALTITTWLHMDPLLSLPAVFVLFAAIGWLLQPLLHRVLSGSRGRPVLMALVFTFGLALAFRGGALTIFGIFTRSLNTALSQGSWNISWGSFFLTIPLIRLAGLLYALGVMGALTYVLKRTDFGLAVRAVAQNKEAAGLMGVDIKRTSAAVYGLYVGVSAMTGVFIGAIVSLNAAMGPDLSLFAFFVVVLAGMGYLSGVPWASFLLGLIQSFFLIYLNPSYVLLALFTILYAILVISPTGMFRRGV
ncbi:MAG TPA: branched-chain amino acid ABC transporter permease [Candidatus Methylomirabilis sp.]|nr:branched-chain amino acid ABC transporter permease [Candidatus Methylomirabilis sp.]